MGETVWRNEFVTIEKVRHFSPTKFRSIRYRNKFAFVRKRMLWAPTYGLTYSLYLDVFLCQYLSIIISKLYELYITRYKITLFLAKNPFLLSKCLHGLPKHLFTGSKQVQGLNRNLNPTKFPVKADIQEDIWIWGLYWRD